MIILKDEIDCKNFSQGQSSIGFAPTMGNLHQGHLTLLTMALEDNDAAIISIYVNPTQFGPNEDFDRYPRTLEKDLEKIKEIENKFPLKKIGVFLPETKTIYPNGTESTVKIDDSISQILEGKMRPTHFEGVATVVKRLFEITKPQKVYFGQKDLQQVVVIKNLIKNYFPNTTLVMAPIIRDSDGLALSSRNQYLAPEERKEALTLPTTLIQLEEKINDSQFDKTISLIEEILKEDKRWNYLVLRHPDTLQEVKQKDKEIAIIGNFQLGSTKLLDNRIIKLI